MNDNRVAVLVEDASRVYPGGVRALDGVTATMGRGEWVAVMGPSGSGKTTLLNLIDGLDRATSGRVTVLGTDLSTFTPDEAATFRREHIGLVFQQFYLIPYLTAVENVMLAQYYHSMVDRRQATRVLDRVGLGERIHHVPSRLSGGEQQRVCIARALINEPEIILADEPTGNLDEASQAAVVDLLREFHRDGKTIVVVTHDRAIAGIAQRTIHLRHGKVVGGHNGGAIKASNVG